MEPTQMSLSLTPAKRCTPPGQPSGPPTVADALADIAGDDTISDARQRALGSALRCLVRLDGRTAGAVVLGAKASITLMERASATGLGIKDSTLANHRAGVRHVVRRYGLLAPLREKRPSIEGDDAWHDLVSALPAGPDFSRLRSFVADCAVEGVSPGLVDNASLEAYADRRAARQGGAKSRDHARRVANQWNRAVREIAGWPQGRLGLTSKSLEYSLPFDAYPASLQLEIEKYLSEIGGAADSGIFAERRRPPVSAATVNTRKYCLRRVLWGGLQAGIPLAGITTLRRVVADDFIRASLGWHHQREGGRAVSVNLSQLAGTVASVLSYLALPDTEARASWDLVKKVKLPPRTEITPRTAKILDALVDAATLARLVHLPRILMDEAERLLAGWTDVSGVRHPPRAEEAGWLASIATAVEILLNAPLRIANLNRLRLGQELRLASGRGGSWRGTILISAASTKNRRGMEVPLGSESVTLIRNYLDRFRPLLPNPQTEWLFPGKGAGDAPRHKGAFGLAITAAIHEHVGVRINPHAFRAIAGSMILEGNPHAIDDVRAILGHSTFATAMIYYRRNNQLDAAERLSESLARHRKATKHFAIRRPFAGDLRRGLGGPR